MITNYQVLARKWRPRNFQALVGQEHILRMLINALEQQRLHHAYLFTGTRGVGKTTLARIFAKCLNCETGITPTPCGTCNACQAIDAGRFLDLIEVDAASRTKVEDTRELLENVQYPPTQGRFKIYLIDEVHMLSGHSFNALLKTLEEPPSYVKFLLATTDPKRLPITILSRCLQFNLMRVPVEKITQQLAHICTEENIQFDLPALQLVAQAADGSMRDALSLLDQTIAYCRDHITVADTEHMLGHVKQTIIYDLLHAVAAQDGKQLITLITQLAEQAPDFDRVLEEILTTLHQTNVTQLIPGTATDENIQKLAAILSPEDVQLYYQIALVGRRDLALAPTLQLGFEMVMLRMLAFRPKQVEKKTPPTATHLEKVEKPAPKPAVKTTPEASEWSKILAQLNLTGLTQALAAHCTIDKITDDKVILMVANQHAAMLNKNLSERIEQALVKYFNKPIKLEINITGSEIHTPAKTQQQENTVRQTNATDAIKNDAHVKTIIDMFGATLDESSITAV